MLGKILIGIGLLLVCSLVLFPWQYTAIHNVDIKSIGSAANAQYAVSRTKMNSVLDPAREVANTLVEQHAEGMRWNRRLLGLAILLSALISIAAGLQRIAKARKKSDTVLMVAIALLGAGSAITTSVAGHIESGATSDLACSRDISDRAEKTIKNLAKERNPDLALQKLAELELEVNRCRP